MCLAENLPGLALPALQCRNSLSCEEALGSRTGLCSLPWGAREAALISLGCTYPASTGFSIHRFQQVKLQITAAADHSTFQPCSDLKIVVSLLLPVWLSVQAQCEALLWAVQSCKHSSVSRGPKEVPQPFCDSVIHELQLWPNKQFKINLLKE